MANGKEQQKMLNIVEMSNIYSAVEAMWWMGRNDFPSKAEYRTFTSMEDGWLNWLADNVTLVHEHWKSRSNEPKCRLRHAVGHLKTDKNVLLQWTVDASSKGKSEISNLMVLFSHVLSPNFQFNSITESLEPIKIYEEKKSKVYMVVQRHGGLDLQDFDIDIPVIDIEMNYGKDWALKHDHLLETLQQKKKKGIALLHGLPGTGKSMYIRHLISTLSENKTVVYLPNQLIPSITDPGFIPLMAEYAGSILVIEDADEAIKARKTGGATVDKLLNLADGILSDFLNMQIICTFNSDITTIDEALLRKGRLILKHKFEKLPKESAQKLSTHLGFKREITEDMTLAEIYNQEDSFSDVKSDAPAPIGFGKR